MSAFLNATLCAMTNPVAASAANTIKTIIAVFQREMDSPKRFISSVREEMVGIFSPLEWACLGKSEYIRGKLLAGKLFDAEGGYDAFCATPDEQPIVEAVDNGHQRSLVQIAAYAGGGPRLVAIGVEAHRDADMRC